LSETPFLLVIAGPNGSGKSTLTQYLLSSGIDFGNYINPDEIAAKLDMPEPERSRQAQMHADFERDSCLRRRISFSFETVMSHPSKVEVMLKAHDAGYDVTLFFVATSDPEINVRRVENRVAAGGHDVPHDRIRSRYQRSRSYLPHAALVARRTVVFDNSALVNLPASAGFLGGNAGLRVIAEVIRLDDNLYELRLEADAPEWIDMCLVRPLQAVEAASEGVVRLTVMRRQSSPD
jgi:predicted ABC-type ATPase